VATQLVASRVLTTVSKLNPKSMPLTVAALLAGVTVAYDCGTRAPAAVSAVNNALPEFTKASLSAGFSPPTRAVTGATVVPLPSVRKV
jgi:hypothetical protein